METAVKAVLSSLIVACVTLVMSGCHTVEGAGRDVEAIGSTTADVAEDTRGYDRQGNPR